MLRSSPPNRETEFFQSCGPLDQSALEGSHLLVGFVWTGLEQGPVRVPFFPPSDPFGGSCDARYVDDDDDDDLPPHVRDRERARKRARKRVCVPDPAKVMVDIFVLTFSLESFLFSGNQCKPQQARSQSVMSYD